MGVLYEFLRTKSPEPSTNDPGIYASWFLSNDEQLKKVRWFLKKKTLPPFANAIATGVKSRLSECKDLDDVSKKLGDAAIEYKAADDTMLSYGDLLKCPQPVVAAWMVTRATFFCLLAIAIKFYHHPHALMALSEMQESGSIAPDSILNQLPNRAPNTESATPSQTEHAPRSVPMEVAPIGQVRSGLETRTPETPKPKPKVKEPQIFRSAFESRHPTEDRSAGTREASVAVTAKADRQKLQGQNVPETSAPSPQPIFRQVPKESHVFSLPTAVSCPNCQEFSRRPISQSYANLLCPYCKKYFEIISFTTQGRPEEIFNKALAAINSAPSNSSDAFIQAIYYIRLLADAGYSPAQHELGSLYEASKLGEPNLKAAEIWHRRAAELHHDSAQEALIRLHQISSDSGSERK